jgi:hypothetical protein
VQTIAGELGMTDRQVQRLIAQLCAAGFLRRDAQYRLNGSQRENAYVFLYHASLAPAAVAAPKQPRPKPAAVHGDKIVTPGATPVPLPEENHLERNLSGRNQQHQSLRSDGAAAALLDLDLYPETVKEVRRYFPRTSASVLRRILQAAFDVLPSATDEQIAAAILPTRDQQTPGLFAITVREFLLRVRPAETKPSPPKCPQCGDGGIVWTPIESSGAANAELASWCTCDAVAEALRANPTLVDDWNCFVVARHPEAAELLSLLPSGPEALS